MKKYALVPINRKILDDGTLEVRRVLISYKRKHKGIYRGTRIIDVDEYFTDKNSSQQYTFKNRYYVLINNSYTDNFIQNSLLGVKRHYRYDLPIPSLEFEAETDFIGRKIFKYTDR